jgi:positive regulator of sigma E activity
MDVGRCFRDAFEVYKQNLVVLVVAALLVDVLGLLTLLILLGPLCGGLSLLTVRAVRSKERRADLNDLFRCFSKFLPLSDEEQHQAAQ